MNIYQRRSMVYAACFLASSLCVAGCKTPTGESRFPIVAKVNRHMPWHDENEPEFGVPTKMDGTWTDTVLYKAGQKPQRGLGGRLIFYPKEGEKPILVDGQMVVYAFDETNRKPTDNKPTRRYVFRAEDLPKRMSKSDVGASYNFWLPWDEAGGPQTEVSLICRFEPKGAPVVVSEQTRHTLPGDVRPEQLAGPGGAGAKPKVPEGVPYKPAQVDLVKDVSQATYNAPIPSVPGANIPAQLPAGQVQPAVLDPAAAANSMNTMSMTLPDSYRQRNLGAGATHTAPLDVRPQAATAPNNPLPMGTPMLPAAGATPSPSTQNIPSAVATPATAAAIRSNGYRLSSAPSGSIGAGQTLAAPSWPTVQTVQPGPSRTLTASPTNPTISPASAQAALSTSAYGSHTLAPTGSMPLTPIGGDTATNVSYAGQ